MTCHHIDWSGLQIKVATLNGQLSPTYYCILCDKELSPEQYKNTLKDIKNHVKDHTLQFFRTPKGETHIKEECVDKDKCPIHGGG